MPPAWFRFYSEVLHDPKIQRLPVDTRWHWVELLCLASEQPSRGTLPEDYADIGYALRLTAKKAEELVGQLIHRGLIEQAEGGLVMHGWQRRQYESDDVTARVRKHRQQGNVSRNVSSAQRNVSETPSDTDTEQKQIRADTEADAEDDARPPEHPFALMYAQKFRARNGGRPCPMTEHAAALALEREYGADACIEAAQDFEWAKHPNYLRPLLQERRDGKTRRHSGAAGQDRGDQEEASPSPFAFLRS